MEGAMTLDNVSNLVILPGWTCTARPGGTARFCTDALAR